MHKCFGLLRQAPDLYSILTYGPTIFNTRGSGTHFRSVATVCLVTAKLFAVSRLILIPIGADGWACEVARIATYTRSFRAFTLFVRFSGVKTWIVRGHGQTVHSGGAITTQKISFMNLISKDPWISRRLPRSSRV